MDTHRLLCYGSHANKLRRGCGEKRIYVTTKGIEYRYWMDENKYIMGNLEMYLNMKIKGEKNWLYNI